MNSMFEILKAHLESDPPSFGDGDSVLTMLYECYNESNPLDNDQIRAGFRVLYEAMNGKPLREMDEIIDPVCTLCRDYERSGFVDGVKVGIFLSDELQQGFATRRANHETHEISSTPQR